MSIYGNATHGQIVLAQLPGLCCDDSFWRPPAVFDPVFEAIGVVPKPVLVVWFPWAAKRVFRLSLSETLPALEQYKFYVPSETMAKAQHVNRLVPEEFDPCSGSSAVALKLIRPQWAAPEAGPDLPISAF
jgi:hypothetical protein